MFGQRLMLGLALVGAASTGASAGGFKSLRYDEDYSSLRSTAARTGDALKSSSWSEAFGTHLTLGGELRLRYEYVDNQLWGQGPQDDNGYLLTRVMLHADTAFGADWRVFVQVKSGLENGRVGGPRATDEDRLDWHQVFLDRNWRGPGKATLILRLGRQELAYGSSRLISFRESPNVRLAFDGARVLYTDASWRVDAFAVHPVETDGGTFDDASDRTKKLWGVYAVTAMLGVPGMKLDLYYLGLKRDRAVFSQGAAKEERHSFGARVWGRAGRWDYNGELVAQAGKFGDGAIHAWTVASDNGFSLPDLPGRPRLGLRANISSGDRSGAEGDLQTFNALFPRGAYFSELGLLGPANLTDVHPGLTLQPMADVTVNLDWDFVWRTTRADGLYGPSVNLLRPGRADASRYAGNSPSLAITWRPSVHWTLNLVSAAFNAGSFLRETGAAGDVSYVSAWATYLF